MNSIENKIPFSNKKNISVRLVLLALCANLLIAVLVSAFQIYYSYQDSMQSAGDRFIQIEKGYLASLEASMWEVNKARIDALLDGLSQLPNVGKVVLTDESNDVYTRNENLDDPFSKMDFILRYSENNSVFELGNLHIELVNHDIIAQVKSRAIGIAITTLCTLLIGSLFTLAFFQLLVSRHLHTMATFARDFNIAKLDIPLTLDRKKSRDIDELDLVVNSINTMQSTLNKELATRSAIEKELRLHKDNLELLVEERTRALRSSIEQLNIASDVAELGVWSWNIKNNVFDWNERMFAMYEQPLTLRGSGLTLQHWSERVHHEDIEATTENLKRAIDTHETFNAVFRIVTPQGGIKYIQAKAEVECDADNNAIKITGINRDITIQRELEAHLTYAKEQADAASAAKSSFLANMSHEIRTPMNAVLGLLQLVQHTELTPRQQDYISKTQTAAKSLLGLLNDILDFSKIDSGKLALDIYPFDFDVLMRDLAVVLSGNQDGNSVEVIFDIDPLLPKILIGDRLRLQQILINLAGNALKFTKQGQVIVAASLIEKSENNVRIHIAVTDTGIGISPEQINYIFDSFVQAEASTTRRFGGTGLGLVISKRLANLMDSDLRVESELGRGSSFWFDITLGTDQTTQEFSHNVLDSIAGLKILVVDDNAINREILVRTITSMGAYADEADGGLIAVQKVQAAKFKNFAYDAVLMDWRMPDLDGLTAAKLIHESSNQTTSPIIIMVSAYGREEIAKQEDAANAPYSDFLIKPVTPQQLTDSLLHALKNVTPVSQQHSSQKIKQQPLSGIRILIVEDNALNRQVASELLNSEGAIIELAEGGLEGVEKVVSSQHSYDVVLMDVQMPDIDGLEATRRIRANAQFKNLPILAMTANASPADREMCIAAGMNDHLGKPIDLDKVVSSIRELIGKEETVTSSANNSTSKLSVKESADLVIDDFPIILKRFGGKLDIYTRLFINFYPDIAKLLKTAKQQLEQKNPKGVAVAFHSIKGIASTMGAKVLAQRAADFEREFNSSEIPETQKIITQETLDELDFLLEKTVIQLESSFTKHKSNNEIDYNETEENPKFVDTDEWKKKLADILPLLIADDLQANDMIETLYESSSAEIKAHLSDVHTQINALQYDAAIVAINHLLDAT